MENIIYETNDNENDNDSGIIQRKKSLSSSSSTVSTASTASASKLQLLQKNGVINESPDDDDIEDDDDVLDGLAVRNGSNDPNEPIYAVVNMKNKYENRARKRSPNQLYSNYNPHKERPNSFHVISSGDYEEVLNGIEVIQIKDEENIYEPVSTHKLMAITKLNHYIFKQKNNLIPDKHTGANNQRTVMALFFQNQYRYADRSGSLEKRTKY